MRMFLVSVAALFLLAGAYSPASAAAAPALAKKPIYGQAHTLIEKAHGWKRRWYRPRVYGYYYRPRVYRYYYRPRVYGYYYRPRVYGYRYRPRRHHWHWKRW